MMEYLFGLVSRLGHWGYVIIFVVAALECAAFAGLVVPGESLVLASGFLAHVGLLNLDAVIAAAAGGAIVGDNIGYRLGERLGRPWLLRYGPRLGLTPEDLAKAEGFFARHGPKAVLLGRFVGFARALVPFVAGATRMPYRRFLVYNAAGAVPWTVCFVLLGYSLGASWRMAETWIGHTSTIVVGATILVVALVWLWRRRARR